MSPLMVAMAAILTTAFLSVLQRAATVVLEREYDTWAPAMARLLTRAAGFMCRRYRKIWWADLVYVQQVKKGSGLIPACFCFLSAPWLAMGHAVVYVTVGESYGSTLKRLLDIVLAGSLLVVSLPLWGALALVIKLGSAGPAITVEERIGVRGRRFQFYRFRSVAAENARVTGLGRFLRRSGIDELPQLINVLEGTMSLVGPRPLKPEEVAVHPQSKLAQLAVKPGLTCWWQVRFRGRQRGVSSHEASDREYVDGLSLWVDIRILLRTPWAVLSCRGPDWC